MHVSSYSYIFFWSHYCVRMQHDERKTVLRFSTKTAQLRQRLSAEDLRYRLRLCSLSEQFKFYIKWVGLVIYRVELTRVWRQNPSTITTVPGGIDELKPAVARNVGYCWNRWVYRMFAFKCQYSGVRSDERSKEGRRFHYSTRACELKSQTNYFGG